MRRHHTGSGRRRAIPDDWAAHHRPVLDGTRGATVALRRPGGTQGEFNKTTGKWDITPHAAYFIGPARVQVLPGAEQERVAGEQEITTLGYAIELDHAVTGMQLDDVVTVTAVGDNGDPWLVGRAMTVTSIESGSLHWSRRLICVDDIETKEP